MPSNPCQTGQATETTIRIVETLQERGEAGVTDLATELGFSKGNVHKHLATLEQSEFVVKRGTRYALSHRFLEIGMETRRSTSISKYVNPLLETVANSVSDTLFFAVEEHQKVVYVSTVSGTDAVSPDIEGRRRPLAETASGRIILSYRSSEPDLPISAESSASTELCEDDLELIRTSEIAILTPGSNYSEIAIPVRGTDSDLIGVVGLFTDPRDHTELKNEYQRLLKSTSERIAKRIGWNQTAGDVH